MLQNSFRLLMRQFTQQHVISVEIFICLRAQLKYLLLKGLAGV